VLPLTVKLRALSDAGTTPANADSDTLEDTAGRGRLGGSPQRAAPLAARIGSLIRRGGSASRDAIDGASARPGPDVVEAPRLPGPRATHPLGTAHPPGGHRR
jgi:hypothetical protein